MATTSSNPTTDRPCGLCSGQPYHDGMPLCIDCQTMLGLLTEDPGDDDEAWADDELEQPRQCRVCQCTDDDCLRCLIRTGRACSWVDDDLCSAVRLGDSGNDGRTDDDRLATKGRAGRRSAAGSEQRDTSSGQRDTSHGQPVATPAPGA